MMAEYYTKQGLTPVEGVEKTVGVSVGKVTIPFHSSQEGMSVSIEDANNYVLTCTSGNELAVDGKKFSKTSKTAILDVYDRKAVRINYCQCLDIEGFCDG